MVSDWSKNFCSIKNIHQLVDFYTTQFISAHGYFNEYRFRFGLSNDRYCPNCLITDQLHDDTPEHLIFHCVAHDKIRRELIESNGIYSKQDLIKLNNREAAIDFKNFCELVLKQRSQFNKST